MRKKLAAATSIALLTVLTATSSAFAGEVKGPPGAGNTNGYTPIENYTAHSYCAFSGLNDYTQGQELFITQSWGQDVRLGLGTSEGPPPGIGCNPTLNPVG